MSRAKPCALGSPRAVGPVRLKLRDSCLLGKGKNKLKVGHGGTLDPLATGVLPIAMGEAIQLCGRMVDASKIYEPYSINISRLHRPHLYPDVVLCMQT